MSIQIASIKALKIWFQNCDANTSSPFEKRNIYSLHYQIMTDMKKK